MASDSESDVSNRVSDNSADRQEGRSEQHDRMVGETQQGAVAENFGRNSSEQRSQDSRNLVQGGALPDLLLEDSGSKNSQKGASDSSAQRQAGSESARQFSDPGLASVDEALQKGSAAANDAPAVRSEGGTGFVDPALSSVNDALQKGSAAKDAPASPQRAEGRDGNAERNKPEAENKKDASDASKPANALTPPEPVTFRDVQPSGYTPGGGGINGGNYDLHDRKAPTTADFFDKKNPSDYVSIAVDRNAHVKDGQLFYSPELDKKYANQLAEKYPNTKPEDRHMWLRAVDSGSAFDNTWGKGGGPSRVDVAVPNAAEAAQINKNGHAKKDPSDAISLTMVPESDKDRVAALAKMPNSPKHEHIKGLDFGYRDEKKPYVRLFDAPTPANNRKR